MRNVQPAFCLECGNSLPRKQGRPRLRCEVCAAWHIRVYSREYRASEREHYRRLFLTVLDVAERQRTDPDTLGHYVSLIDWTALSIMSPSNGDNASKEAQRA